MVRYDEIGGNKAVVFKDKIRVIQAEMLVLTKLCVEASC